MLQLPHVEPCRIVFHPPRLLGVTVQNVARVAAQTRMRFHAYHRMLAGMNSHKMEQVLEQGAAVRKSRRERVDGGWSTYIAKGKHGTVSLEQRKLRVQ